MRNDGTPCIAAAAQGASTCPFHFAENVGKRRVVTNVLRDAGCVSAGPLHETRTWFGCLVFLFYLSLLFLAFCYHSLCDAVRGIAGRPRYLSPPGELPVAIPDYPLAGLDNVYLWIEGRGPEAHRDLYVKVSDRLRYAGIACVEMDALFATPLHPILNIESDFLGFSSYIYYRLNILEPGADSMRAVWTHHVMDGCIRTDAGRMTEDEQLDFALGNLFHRIRQGGPTEA